MEKLQINTKKSLFDPIVIEIDGIEFHAREMNRETLKEINGIAEKSGEDPTLLYDEVKYIFQIQNKKEEKIIDKIDLRQIKEIISFVRNQIFFPKLSKREQLEENQSKKKDKVSGKIPSNKSRSKSGMNGKDGQAESD